VHAAVNAVQNLKSLESQIQKGENTQYEATYKTTTGAQSSSTVTIAQGHGGKWAYIASASDGGGATSWVANGKDTYDCTQATSGGKWSCAESAEASGNDAIDGSPALGYLGSDYYTVVVAISAAAAFKGYDVSNTSTSVNGISLKCTSIKGKDNGQSFDDEWCITDDGILGLVRYTDTTDASQSTAFSITSLNKSPSASLFDAPSGASITMETT
jgi:hypothetical protein